MDYLTRRPNYDKEPEIVIEGHDNDAWRGYGDIADQIRQKMDKDKYIIVIDCYPGVREEILGNFKARLKPELVIDADDLFFDGDTITELIKEHLTDDRVFGVMYDGAMEDFIDASKWNSYKSLVEGIEKGIVLICGVGASFIADGDTLIYADLARWEIQQRYRSRELGNFKVHNQNVNILEKYKRGYFVEWRVADKHKAELFEKLDFLLDTNEKEDPKMITGEAFRAALKQAAHRPFRLVPYFDEGIWGGKWMEQVCDLKPSENKYAWCFDGVPEENSLYLKFGAIRVEVPSLDMVLYQPKQLLGSRVYQMFGAEFPIRFDFLDTIHGGNLSLQIHPTNEYVKDHFNMKYTQDESYYILDAEEGACVYLGLKDNVDRQEMIRELKMAEKGGDSFEVEKYVNKFDAKAHDHFLIPAGTIHCSGNSCMVLEISATPYIFTFKLWDWDRVGLDGIPRPTHVSRGEKVINWDRTTEWVRKNLVNNNKIITEDGYTEELTAINELGFVETRRYQLDKKILLHTEDNVNVFNLIDGDEATIEGMDASFEPFTVHYAETFIIPASVGDFTIRPSGLSEGKKISVVRAYVRC